MRMNNQTRTKINSNLYGICRNYFKQIPLDEIFNIIKANGLTPIQEDKTEWAGFLCGAIGTARINLIDSMTHKDIINSLLVINWYKMESGNYEITVYVS